MMENKVLSHCHHSDEVDNCSMASQIVQQLAELFLSFLEIVTQLCLQTL